MSEKEYKARCETMFKRNTVLLNQQMIDAEQIRNLQKQNGELTDKFAELEQENQKLKEQYAKECEDVCYVVTNYNKQLTKAKEHIKTLLDCLKQDTNDPQTNYYVCQYMDKAEQFLKDSEVKK